MFRQAERANKYRIINFNSIFWSNFKKFDLVFHFWIKKIKYFKFNLKKKKNDKNRRVYLNLETLMDEAKMSKRQES